MGSSSRRCKRRILRHQKWEDLPNGAFKCLQSSDLECCHRRPVRNHQRSIQLLLRWAEFTQPVRAALPPNAAARGTAISALTAALQASVGCFRSNADPTEITTTWLGRQAQAASVRTFSSAVATASRASQIFPSPRVFANCDRLPYGLRRLPAA